MKKKARGSIEYTILVVFTDGQINDMQPATDALVESAFLPLSVIIIGIGNSDFENMHVLDGEKGTLRHSNGQLDRREICQFVPFKRFNHDHNALARHVLEKIPDQLISYYQLMNIRPNPPQKLSLNDLNLNQTANILPQVLQTQSSAILVDPRMQMGMSPIMQTDEAFQKENTVLLMPQNIMKGNDMNSGMAINLGMGAGMNQKEVGVGGYTRV